MKLKIRNLLGVVSNENESNLSAETSSFITGNLNKVHLEAKDYVEKCNGEISYDHFQEIVLDQDKFNIVKSGGEFRNEYVYDPKYYFLSITGDTINLHNRIDTEQ